MRLIRLAMFVGLLTAIPICSVIYFGVDRLEKAATQSKDLKESLSAILPLPDMVDVDTDLVPIRRGPDFPFTREISNQDGRSLDVVVTGRGSDDLHFLSLRDNRSYRYPIAGLSGADQAFAEKLPVHEPGPDDFPVPRLLTNWQGRTLVTMIEGRSQFDVHFRTLPNSETYIYPISRLSQGDRNFIFGLPVNR